MLLQQWLLDASPEQWYNMARMVDQNQAGVLLISLFIDTDFLPNHHLAVPTNHFSQENRAFLSPPNPRKSGADGLRH